MTVLDIVGGVRRLVVERKGRIEVEEYLNPGPRIGLKYIPRYDLVIRKDSTDNILPMDCIEVFTKGPVPDRILSKILLELTIKLPPGEADTLKIPSPQGEEVADGWWRQRIKWVLVEQKALL